MTFAHAHQGPMMFAGSAARRIAQRLEGHGYELLVRLESFLVTGESVLVADEPPDAA